MTTQSGLLTNIMDKLDSLPLSFDITTDVELLPSLTDAMREMKILSYTDIIVGSETELYVELRSVWWALFRFRNTSSVNFKYSTGNDGRAVDKTKVVEEIDRIMEKIGNMYTQWKSTTSILTATSTSGGLWSRTARTSDELL